MRLRDCIFIAGFVSALSACAASNFDTAHSAITSPVVGEIDWSVSPEHGATINQYYCSGFIYGANVGWIQLGDGSPADLFQYRNNSAADFGVNASPSGALRGFAYGANIGWINFEALGDPRVDWDTGMFHGRIWSANIGWIDLENSTQYLRLDSVAEAPDSDGDDLPDAWEIQHTSNLTTLSGSLDADGDGQSDRDEYLAGTNPVSAIDSFSVTVSLSVNPLTATLRWPTTAGYLYYVDERIALDTSAPWTPTSAEPQTGSGSPMTLAVPSTNGPAFYRVRAVPPRLLLNLKQSDAAVWPSRPRPL